MQLISRMLLCSSLFFIPTSILVVIFLWDVFIACLYLQSSPHCAPSNRIFRHHEQLDRSKQLNSSQRHWERYILLRHKWSWHMRPSAKYHPVPRDQVFLPAYTYLDDTQLIRSSSGYPMCDQFASISSGNFNKTLATYGSNYIVAISNAVISANPSYCGKRLQAYVNETLVDKVFVVWDGCLRCNQDYGVDFSSTAFADLFGESHCPDGVESSGFRWELMKEVIYDANGTLMGRVPGSSISSGTRLSRFSRVVAKGR
jgi:hypothetical protein